jgi:hypothetical protein
MALKRPKGPAGTLVVLKHIFEMLKGNPLGDSHVGNLGAGCARNTTTSAASASRCSAISSALQWLGPRARELQALLRRRP